MTAFPFLSDEWIEQARALRARYADEVPSPPVPVRLNVLVTDIPHRDDDLAGHIDTSSGQVAIERGHVEDPEMTITLDYITARAVFVDRDQQVVMQSFFAGKILVEGDASKLLALQGPPPSDDSGLAIELYRELQSFTE